MMTLDSPLLTKKSFLRKLFLPTRRKTTASDHLDPSALLYGSCPPLFCDADSSTRLQPLSVFVATWNVGGKSPHDGINLDDYFQIFNPSDIYVLGFQEIVPLNAGNVLVVEDNEPAAKWLSCINRTLNRSHTGVSNKKKPKSSLPFQKPAFKRLCRNFRTESARRLKSCNCECSSDEDDDGACSGYGLEYGMVMAKQMVGIFLTIWAKREIVSSIRHLRVSCIGRGIMGCLGNKGCISVSMTIHQTSFCFVCSHLASGEKDGDELRRNADVIEILKTTQFRRVCRSPNNRVPEKIVDHDRVLWLGDLNYRIALSYAETKKLVEKNDWDTLFDNDQLKRERDAGRVFRGWTEGKICFAPTYKYSYNSDIYAGETAETRRKRRTPAWCDRILWREKGITQVNYVRLESKFSDHRPVCSTFRVDVEVLRSLAYCDGF